MFVTHLVFVSNWPTNVEYVTSTDAFSRYVYSTWSSENHTNLAATLASFLGYNQDVDLVAHVLLRT